MTNPRKIDSWVNSCLRKTKMAEKHANAIVKRAESEGTYLRTYKCPHCGAFHVTSKPLREDDKKPIAEIPVEQKTLEWRSMETAPLDGRKVKLLIKYKIIKAYFVPGEWIWRDEKGSELPEPTSWMPLK